jgi:hypothetical protein
MPRNYEDISGEKNPNYKTGYCMKGKRNSLYNSWQGMKSRCLRKTHPKYYRYGGRGISICKEWIDFKGFLDWALNNGWKEGYSIDRIDNDGNYCPENCRWVSVSENSRKKSTTKIDIITAQEIRSRINEDWYSLAKEYGCTHGNIWFIMNNFTHVDEGECAKKIKEYKETKSRR